jgi:hypothetical protein
MKSEEAVNTGVSMYTLAGWLSILQAVIILPKVGADLFVEYLTQSGYGILQLFIGFDVVSKLLGIYVLFIFRRLLNERHSFHKVDKLIMALIYSYAAIALFWGLDLVLNQQFNTLFALPVIYVFSSLISIVYAIRLLKLESNLSGLLKPYVYSTIAGGVFGVTIVLGEYGRTIFMVSLILLGMILLRAESEPEYL